MRLQYHGSLENITLTDEICVESCSASLRSWFNTVAEKCNGDDSETDGVPMQLGGNIWAGWNETCISPLGDAKTLAAIKKAWSDQRLLSSGNAPSVVQISPPEDAEVAKGTTLHCGRWHIVKESDTCDDLCEGKNLFQRYLFYKANPSLDMKICHESLVPGTTLCMASIPGWDTKNARDPLR